MLDGPFVYLDLTRDKQIFVSDSKLCCRCEVSTLKRGLCKNVTARVNPGVTGYPGNLARCASPEMRVQASNVYLSSHAAFQYAEGILIWGTQHTETCGMRKGDRTWDQ